MTISTTTASPASADASGNPFGFLTALAGDATNAFGVYEGANVAKGLNSTSLMYVILGLGALALVGLVVFKH